MDFEAAAAMVNQLVKRVTPAQREAIVRHVVENGCSVVHACWELFGKAKGMPCRCTPCTEALLTGEVVVRVLVSREVVC